MNNFLKLVASILSLVIILNVILCFYFTIHFYQQTRDITLSIHKSFGMIIMIYTFLVLGIQEKIIRLLKK